VSLVEEFNSESTDSQLNAEHRFARIVLFFFLIWGDTCSLCMPVLRPASQAGPVCNPREGTSVVLHDTIKLT